jgi:hypothetical protein
MLVGTLGVTAPAACSLDESIDTIKREVGKLPRLPRDLGPPQRVFARRFVAPIRDAPSSDATQIGYLRAGALLHSTTTEPHGYEGCDGGWYELDTGGYVCDERDVIVFSGDRLPELRARQPDRDAVMPYEYVTVRRKTPLYKRIPQEEEIYEVPPDPEPTDETDSAVGPAEPADIDNPLVARILRPGFYVSLDRSFERDGRTYWRTQQNGFVDERALRRKPWSEFRGQVLDGQRWTLPVAVTRVEDARVYRQNERGKLRATRQTLGRRTWLPVRARRRIGGKAYVVIDEERLVAEMDALIIEPSAPPSEVAPTDRWIEVDLSNQVVVAYDGLKPRYVTLASTGRARTPGPEFNYLTPRGLFRIRGKHLTSTMDNDEPGEPPYSLEDVPYVMYFRGAYAFHSAFWHDRFGRPRSHGCINLAPTDAKWLYNWSGPDLPATWHGGSATEDNPGTWVWIHGETPGKQHRQDP